MRTFSLFFKMVFFLAAIIVLMSLNLNFLDLAETAQRKPSIPLKDTNYPVPQDALFVSTKGSDTNPGTETAPLRTIQRAVGTAQVGATIVIRQGTYRESIPYINKRLTFQPYPHEKVCMKGSMEVTDWVKDGTIWRRDKWTHKFAPDADQRALDPAYPMAKYPDQVFVDEDALKQVATKAEVISGTFFVDYGTNQLFIGDNPAGRTVEASAYVFALNFQFGSDSSIVRGLGFMQYSPNYSQNNGPAMVKGNAQKLIFENNTFAYSANRGLSVYGMDAVIRGNIFIYNGEGGLSGYKSDRTIIEGNYIGYNNTERFKAGWDANGAKFGTSNSVVWRDNIVEHNFGGGLWCDYQCRDNLFVKNIVRYNGPNHGIFYEVSQGGIIASNLVYGNEGTGIGLSVSSNTKIYNNTLSKNGTNIYVTDSGGNVTNIIIKNNILSNVNDSPPSANYYGALLYTHDYSNNKSADDMIAELDHNAYYRSSPSSPATLILWAKRGSYKNLSAFRQAQRKESTGIAIDAQAGNPFFVDEANGNYHLKASSPAKGKGAPLPKDVAGAIGVISGIPVDIGALLWPGSTHIGPKMKNH